MSFRVTLTLPNEPEQIILLNNVTLEFAYGLWLGDSGFKYHVIEEISRLDEYGNIIRKYDPSSLQDINLTGLVIDAGDYEYEREEGEPKRDSSDIRSEEGELDLTWREFILRLTNNISPSRRYTAQMIEEYGEYREPYIVQFDSLDFIRGIATISRWRGKNWRDILYNIHDNLDTKIEVTNM